MNGTFDFIRRFGAGINIGNSLDAPDGETSWGNPPISRELIRFYRNEGFRSIRIPVTWHRHLDGAGHSIRSEFLDRVREIVGWCMDEGFVVIVNLHHEGGWLFPDNESSVAFEFGRLWEQIARHFADCGDNLVFEAFNEIRNGEDWCGNDEAYKAVSRLAERFVSTIRAAGGCNARRYLMIPTYAASVGESACRSWVRVANDDRLIATVHCYAPHEFTHQSAGPKEYHPDWCRPELESVFACLKRNFLDRGIPVVVGEVGVKQENGIPKEDGRIRWARDVADFSARNGIPLIVWEDGGWFQLVDRTNARWTHHDLAKAYLDSVIPDNKFDATIRGQRIRGVNLGGWLVLERWMKESLFEGVDGTDETAFSVQLGREEASRRLREHWDTWITETDFKWISEHGFNAVRIPVGHWIFGAASGYPYHERYGADPHPYVDGGIERLDRAFDWAERHGLMILVDLHCAPGCQNGFDNGGMEGVIDWHKRSNWFSRVAKRLKGKKEYVDFTIDTLERIAERYGRRKALWGIETLNEPHWDISDEVLQHFNRRAYTAIRKHCPPENGAVVIHDGFRGPRIREVFGGRYQEPGFSNVVLDVHRYQCFDNGLKALDAVGNIRQAQGPLAYELCGLEACLLWTVCGEWSLAVGGHRTDAERQAFFETQNNSFRNCHGSFFWSYKIESGDPAWSLRDAVERGLQL